ncbi:MAG: hypothetical protein DELT_00826 [Desulfovibrio sp.]
MFQKRENVSAAFRRLSINHVIVSTSTTIKDGLYPIFHKKQVFFFTNRKTFSAREGIKKIP